MWLILVACPAPAAAGYFVESTENFRGQDYGGATTNEWSFRNPTVRGSNAMYRNKELTREISSLDSRWGVSGTYQVPRGSRYFSATFKWDVRLAAARVRGGSPVTTDAGGPNSTALQLVATSPGCSGCRVSTDVTDVVRADSASPLQQRGSWVWGEDGGGLWGHRYTETYLVKVVVSVTSGSLPSTVELQTFFTSRSRLGGVGDVYLYFAADYNSPFTRSG